VGTCIASGTILAITRGCKERAPKTIMKSIGYKRGITAEGGRLIGGPVGEVRTKFWIFEILPTLAYQYFLLNLIELHIFNCRKGVYTWVPAGTYGYR
jgi:hypothetical protein